MVELLVVIIVISILASAVLIASAAVLDRFRVTNTKAVLQVVSDACEEFKREQTAKPTIVKAAKTVTWDPNVVNRKYGYRDRYGDYPPDELEVFATVGMPGWDPPSGAQSNSLAPGSQNMGGQIVKSHINPEPDPSGWQPMRFYTDGDITKDPLEHRDLAALIVAIETLGDASASMLAKIPERNRVAGVLGPNDSPAIFLDRFGGTDCQTDVWDACDLQIRYVVDDWGVPISYFAQRDRDAGESAAITAALASNNHLQWREASTAFVKANRGLPLVMSYGPDGEDQLTAEAMTTSGGPGSVTAPASLPGDFAGTSPDRTIDHPMNADNIYLDPSLTEKFAKGLP